MHHLPRRSVIVAPATSQLEEIEVRPPGPGELLVQVIANGLCASELPTWLHGPPDGTPTALGHEPVGRVVEVGAGFMGLCLIQLLATSPIGELVAIDVRDDAKQASLAYGASTAGNPEDMDQMNDAFDVVFEVSGTQGGLDLATSLTRPAGTRPTPT